MCRTKAAVSPWAVAVTGLFLALSDWPTVLALFLAAALHELGHYGAIRWYGVGVSGIYFTVFDAELRLRGRLSYGAELAITAAGPLVNVTIALFFATLGRWWAGFYLLSGAQAVLGAFNLLPVRPLDGGQLLWLAVAYLTEPFTADRVCRAVSVAVSLAVTLLAALLLQRTGQGMFLLFGTLVLTYHAMGEKGLAKGHKKRYNI